MKFCDKTYGRICFFWNLLSQLRVCSSDSSQLIFFLIAYSSYHSPSIYLIEMIKMRMSVRFIVCKKAITLVHIFSYRLWVVETCVVCYWFLSECKTFFCLKGKKNVTIKEMKADEQSLKRCHTNDSLSSILKGCSVNDWVL